MAEQQGAEIGPPAFRFGPSDDDKFGAVEAFDLAPQAAIAGRISRIAAFRDNALDPHRAGFVVKCRTLADDMVAAVQRCGSVREQDPESLLPLEQWMLAQILAV